MTKPNAPAVEERREPEAQPEPEARPVTLDELGQAGTPLGEYVRRGVTVGDLKRRAT